MLSVARGEWLRRSSDVAWLEQGEVVWRFSFDADAGKPFFHPLGVRGFGSMTDFKPEDHPWHYGLWFSWKYINNANYWVEDRASGRAEGRTSWSASAIETGEDGSALIRMHLAYVHPSGRVDLSENRVIRVGAPADNGSYEIDWCADFVAGVEGAVLDRTPMPDEPDGRFNGGYAGFSIRLASAPNSFAVVSDAGPLPGYIQERSRPVAKAIGLNITNVKKQTGGLAVACPVGGDPVIGTPWYIVNSPGMRFVCAAVLAPGPMRMAPGERKSLRYRVYLRPGSWTEKDLKALR